MGVALIPRFVAERVKHFGVWSVVASRRRVPVGAGERPGQQWRLGSGRSVNGDGPIDIKGWRESVIDRTVSPGRTVRLKGGRRGSLLESGNGRSRPTVRASTSAQPLGARSRPTWVSQSTTCPGPATSPRSRMVNETSLTSISTNTTARPVQADRMQR